MEPVRKMWLRMQLSRSCQGVIYMLLLPSTVFLHFTQAAHLDQLESCQLPVKVHGMASTHTFYSAIDWPWNYFQFGVFVGELQYSDLVWSPYVYETALDRWLSH